MGTTRASIPLLDDHREKKSSGGGGATSFQTLGNIMVSLLGTGVLGLPYAFRVCGWLSGSLGLATAAAAVYYCMLLLIQCRNKMEAEEEEEEEEREDDGTLRIQTYGDLGAEAYGFPGRCLTEVLVLMSYAGSGVSYLISMGENLSSVFSSYGVSPPAFVFGLFLPVEIALSFVRSFTVLAPFSIFANTCNVLAMAIVLAGDFQQLGKLSEQARSRRSAYNGPWSLPFAGGVAVFCLEGFGVTLALEASMAERRKFPWVLLQAFLGLAPVFICFGVFGYLAYGDETNEIITLNLPGDWLSTIVKVGLCIAPTFAIPMTIHPVNEIVENKLDSSEWFQKLCHKLPGGKLLGPEAVRVLIDVAVALLSTSVPGFTVFISFTGSTVCALLAFVLPSTFHLKLVGSSLTLWQRVLDSCILAIGLVFAGYSIYSAISGHPIGS